MTAIRDVTPQEERPSAKPATRQPPPDRAGGRAAVDAFEITGLTPGSWDVLVSAEPGLVGFVRDLPLSEGGELRVEVSRPSGAIVELHADGRFVERLPRVIVDGREWTALSAYGTATDRVTVPAGRVRVALHDPELARPIAERELHIAPGGIVELRVADLGG